MDLEYQNYDEKLINKDISMYMRLGFIKKVYGILAAQVTLSVIFILISFTDAFAQFAITNIWLYWLCLFSGIASICFLCCYKNKVPHNYIILGIFTFSMSYMLAVMTSFFTPRSVILSGFLTLGVVIALTVYAFNTKTDFSYLYSFLFVSLFVFMIIGLFSFLFGPFFEMIYCIFGVLLFSLWLIYDTQCIMGKIGDVYTIDDYVIAAIDVYLDILNLFVMILRLLGDRR